MSDSYNSIFDDHYFAKGCGRPYQRDEHWLTFFDQIAEKIIHTIQPETVLDAGCAMGFLVEGLRNRGVEAWGVDISEYAIANVHESIRDVCWVGSVADPLPRKYDLIVSIEVLEHMQAAEAEQAIVNFCQHCDDILFSSSPLDFKEATHFNVQSPEVWAELFARQGFYRDVDYDASFITPWATRFRRSQEPVHRIARDYERRFWLLWKENTDLRELISEQRSQIISADRRIQTQDTQLGLKDDRISLLKERVEELNERSQQLDRIIQGGRWQLLTKLEQFRLKIIPRESYREELYHLVISTARRGISWLRSILARFRGRRKIVGAQTTGAKAYSYQDWIKDHRLSADELTEQRAIAEWFEYRPLISILTPVYNTPLSVLRAAIHSVLEQTYPNWELCLVNGASTREGLRELLDEFSHLNERITVQHLDQNLGISGNTNIALELAQGEFIALLDHDDLLAPNALFEVVRRLNKKPETDIIYFDEDKISASGEVRSWPFFKPDWSPEMLLSANYLTHPVIRRSLVEGVGAFDPDKDGTQDWDLIFRCAEKTDRIEHISKILYHWRQVGGSAASKLDAKSYVFDRQLRCVEEHLTRQGVEGVSASFPDPGFLRVTWPISGEKISIIIPTKDNLKYLQQCLDSIFRLTTYPDYEVILVDNQSQNPETLHYYEKLIVDPKVSIIHYDRRFNFSAVNNFGARHASGKYLLFLNNDVEILDSDWLAEMVRWGERPGVGIVGAKLLYPDKTIQHAGVVVGMQGHASHVFMGAREKQGGLFGSTDWYRNYTAVTGACMLISQQLFAEVGGFNENYELVFSDIEICVRVFQSGYRIVYTPYARLIHHEGKSRGKFMPPEDLRLGAEHFEEIVRQGDPYFNPNLSYTSSTPALSRPDEENRVDRLNRLVAIFSGNKKEDRQEA